MRLARHLVEKDIRRLAVPVAAWLALALTATLLVRVTSVPTEVALGGDVIGWISGLRLITDLLGAVATIGAVMLTAQLVQEDPPLGSDPMWLTRPISRGRMFAAKLATALLLLLAVPLLLLITIWLASGFSVKEIAWAAWEFGFSQVVVIAVAGGLAAITADLGKFIFALIGVGLVTLGLGAYRLNEWQLDEVDAAVIQTRGTLVFLVGLAIGPMAGALQYWQGRPRRSWGLMAAGAILMLAIRLAWPWDTLAAFPGVAGRWPRVTAGERERVGAVSLMVSDGNATPTMKIEVGALPAKDEFVTPWNGKAIVREAGGEEMTVFFERSDRWGEAAVRCVLGLAPGEAVVPWRVRLTAQESTRPLTFGEETALKGEMRYARMRAQVVAELPWRPGAQVRTGSATTRIASIVAPANTTRQVLTIEERDAWLSAVSGAGGRAQLRATDEARRDVFALVNRRLGICQFLQVRERGAMRQNSLLMSAGTLECEAPTRLVDGRWVEVPDWLQDAVLVKVRFEVIDRWLAQLKVERVRTVREATSP